MTLSINEYIIHPKRTKPKDKFSTLLDLNILTSETIVHFRFQ